MVNRPKQIGTAGETAVVRYLNAHGFGGAERSALHGSADVGDVTGTPCLAWEVKAGQAAETASDAQVDAWLDETETERCNKGADVGVLVLKRKGKGAQNAGLWWAVLPGWAFCYLADHATGCHSNDTPDGYLSTYGHIPTARMHLAQAVTLLRLAGYGDPL